MNKWGPGFDNNVWPHHGTCHSCSAFPYSLWKCNFCRWKTWNEKDEDNYKNKYKKEK